MTKKIQFLGAAGNVTGSSTLLEINGTRILVDCGLHQEWKYKERNWSPFAIPPDSIDTVLLTHAHLDHCGLLPKLVRDGFCGKIVCTQATAEIAKIVIADSAHIQEEDAKYKAKRHRKEKKKSRHPIKPLYTKEDARKVDPLFHPTTNNTPVKIADSIEATFHCAGHILGSSMVMIEADGERFLFSGDIGRKSRPILEDPTTFEQADYIIVESTYGDRVHEKGDDAEKELEETIVSALKSMGKVIIPAFSIERSQEILYHLKSLMDERKIPELMVFLDSPMAVRVTKIFKRHPELFDEDMREMLRDAGSPFNFPTLKLVLQAEESKAINHMQGTYIVIAGSGMCTGGRIKHHLVHNIGKSQNTILFVGYQARGTLGRKISEGADIVRILGREHKVRASVRQISGFSGHADKKDLFEWISSLKNLPKKVFVNHGDDDASAVFAHRLREENGWDAVVPEYQEAFEL